MNKQDIEILLEYGTNIIEKMGLCGEIINFRPHFRGDVKNSLIVIDDIEEFEDEILDSWRAESKIKRFFLNAKLNNNILLFACTDDIEEHFEDVDTFLFDPKQCIHLSHKESSSEIYDKLLEDYKKSKIDCQLSYDEFEKIYAAIETKSFIKSVGIADYIYEYSVKNMILENKKVVNYKMFESIIEKEKIAEEKEEDIDQLIGLDNIKSQLESLYNYLEFSKKIKLKSNLYLNLFFLGNPGTGKTTVARMYAKKLFDLGYIKENKLIEVVPNDLMGEYVGQTKNKTRSILKKAENGVLFIDEAYLLYTENYSRGKNPYMEEAVVELIKYLENPKNIVIFAGYPEEMRKIYKTNTGLKSRIYGEIIFEDYTPLELYEILKSELKGKGLEIDVKSRKKIIKYIENLQKEDNFGNARTTKQLAQRMIINHANRKIDARVLDYKDLPEYANTTVQTKMGFGVYNGK